MTTNSKPVAIRIRLGDSSMQSDVIYITEAAVKLGISKGAMQVRVHRLMATGADQDIPKPFMLHGKWAWLREEFDAFIEEKARKAKA